MLIQKGELVSTKIRQAQIQFQCHLLHLQSQLLNSQDKYQTSSPGLQQSYPDVLEEFEEAHWDTHLRHLTSGEIVTYHPVNILNFWRLGYFTERAY